MHAILDRTELAIYAWIVIRFFGEEDAR